MASAFVLLRSTVDGSPTPSFGWTGLCRLTMLFPIGPFSTKETQETFVSGIPYAHKLQRGIPFVDSFIYNVLENLGLHIWLSFTSLSFKRISVSSYLVGSMKLIHFNWS